MPTTISAPMPKCVRLCSVVLLFLTPIAAAGQCPEQPGTTWKFSSTKIVAKPNDIPPVSCATKDVNLNQILDCGTFKVTGRFNNLFYMKPPPFSRLPNSIGIYKLGIILLTVDPSPSEYYMLTDKKDRNFNFANYETNKSVVGLCSEDGNTSAAVSVITLANDQARIVITQSVGFIRIAMPKPEF